MENNPITKSQDTTVLGTFQGTPGGETARSSATLASALMSILNKMRELASTLSNLNSKIAEAVSKDIKNSAQENFKGAIIGATVALAGAALNAGLTFKAHRPSEELMTAKNNVAESTLAQESLNDLRAPINPERMAQAESQAALLETHKATLEELQGAHSQNVNLAPTKSAVINSTSQSASGITTGVYAKNAADEDAQKVKDQQTLEANTKMADSMENQAETLKQRIAQANQSGRDAQ